MRSRVTCSEIVRRATGSFFSPDQERVDADTAPKTEPRSDTFLKQVGQHGRCRTLKEFLACGQCPGAVVIGEFLACPAARHQAENFGFRQRRVAARIQANIVADAAEREEYAVVPQFRFGLHVDARLDSKPDRQNPRSHG